MDWRTAVASESVTRSSSEGANAASRLNQGPLAYQAEEVGAIRRLFVEALLLQPNDPEALDALGRATGQARWIDRALAVAPDLSAAQINFSAFATTAEEFRRAERALRRAISSSPAAAEAWFNLALVRTRGAGAITAYRRVLALDPSALDATANLGDVLRLGDPLIAAIKPYRRAHALAPPDGRCLKNLMFCLHYDPETPSEELFRLHRRWAALQARQPSYGFSNTRDPERRLRIGYLSADLYDHPVGRNVVGLMENHDSSAIEVYVYDIRAGEDDVVSGVDQIAARIRASARKWESFGNFDGPALAEVIRKDCVDVLVVLAGHTLFNRLDVAALKPAPVQIGMHDFTTSGLREMDAFFGDEILTPEGGEERFSEEIVRLPCFYLHQPLPEVPPQRREGSGVVFGSCSNPAKLNDRVIEIWARLLAGVPKARLALKYRDRFGDPDVQRRWRTRMESHGVSSDRLDFIVGNETVESHLSAVSGFDVALDPFPFGGCTTTYEALWMGVPVVTLAGRRFVGRMSAAMLHHVDLDCLIAATESDYVDLAAAMASDAARRSSLRQTLRARLKSSPLLDTEAYTCSFEKAVRQLWRKWCVHR